MKKISYFENTPVLTVPEGLDIWNINDPQATATLKRAEELVQDITTGKLAGVVVPYGWKLTTLTIERTIIELNIFERFMAKVRSLWSGDHD